MSEMESLDIFEGYVTTIPTEEEFFKNESNVLCLEPK